MSIEFKILGTYIFEVIAPAVLGGSEFTNVKLSGIVSYEDAKRITNIDLKYRQVYPALPPGTPDTPRLQTYYVFTTQAGERIVMCDQWILKDTIRLVSLVNFNIEFTEQTVETVEQVRKLLVSAGYTSFSIRQHGM